MDDMGGTQQAATAAEIQVSLEKCAQQRQHYYQGLRALSIRFEEDDTGAEQDLPKFKVLLEPIHEHLSRGLKQCLDPWLGRYLVITHYSGHGAVGPLQRLWFNAKPHSKPKFTLNALTGSVVYSFQASEVPIDAVFIIDSSEAGSAKLNMEVDDTFELLAPVPEQKTASRTLGAQNQKRTLAAELSNASAVTQSKALSVDFAEHFDSAYSFSFAKFPVHKLLSGPVSIPQSPTTAI
ncbi:uncharacterized protein GIQ15_05822 [Arthroderma uncinatum]|uniref:uncharacterized protein n=1 Tax=Arthroderma uncinatum TaxID=74035 RepID=UPI00144A570B|nr:uncharacterized protein GIQ15_05822 [Arthroderma uncinatum]KAF3480475.1 hypothetical protein GIQ15_05822 [Arthroderma uncinatum]